jgi:hypothetical protein
VADEVCQRVRIQLMVGTAQVGPRLGTYMGRGSLRNWLRVMAVHLIPQLPAPLQQGSSDDNILQVLEALPRRGRTRSWTSSAAGFSGTSVWPCGMPSPG